MYDEEEFLPLSGVQHFAFCRRQWALIHIEQQWEGNLRTVEGDLLHQKVHDAFSSEKRGDLLVSRGMPVRSKMLGASGQCDAVEFHRDDERGVSLFGREGKYLPLPVEYKRGSPKQDDCDTLQLTAQAMCLEEMLCCDIPAGAMFYGATRRRLKVEFTAALRERTRAMFAEMHALYARGYTPIVKRTKACNACSLKDICLPGRGKNRSVGAYLEQALAQAEDALPTDVSILI